jgi:hypothetical protein
MANESALAIATNIFTAPSEAFPVIKEHRKVLLPLLALVIGYSVVSVLYTATVDLPWLMEQQLRMSNPAMTDQQREQAIAAATNVPVSVYGAIGAVTTCAGVLLVMLITSVYYTVVSFFSHDGVRLRQWFALIAWCTLPTLLGAVAQTVNIIVNDTRFMPQDQLNPLALGNLLSIDRTNLTIMQRSVLAIDLTMLWSIALSVLGYQAFTKSSIVKAVAIVLGPIALIVAVSSAVALLR